MRVDGFEEGAVVLEQVPVEGSATTPVCLVGEEALLVLCVGHELGRRQRGGGQGARTIRSKKDTACARSSVPGECFDSSLAGCARDGQLRVVDKAGQEGEEQSAPAAKAAGERGRASCQHD